MEGAAVLTNRYFPGNLSLNGGTDQLSVVSHQFRINGVALTNSTGGVVGTVINTNAGPGVLLIDASGTNGTLVVVTNGFLGKIGGQPTNSNLSNWSLIATNDIGSIGAQPTNANLTAWSLLSTTNKQNASLNLTNWSSIATNDIGSIGAQPTNANLTKWATVATNNIGAIGAQPTNATLTLLTTAGTNGFLGQIGGQPTNANLSNWALIATNNIGAIGAQPTNANLSNWALIATNNIGAIGAQPTNANLSNWALIATNNIGQIGAQPTNTALSALATAGTNGFAGQIGAQATNVALTALGTAPTIPAFFTSDATNFFWFDPSQYIFEWDDFMESASGTSGPFGRLGFVARTANSGNISNGTGDTNHPGLMSINTGAANGICNFCTAASELRLGGGYWDVEWLIKTPSALAIDANYYEIRCGLINNDATSNIVNGVFFRYATNAASAKLTWQFVTRANNSENITDSSVTVQVSTYYKLRIRINTDGTVALGNVNGGGDLSGNNATIPVATGREIGIACGTIATAFTTTRSTLLDYVKVYHKMLVAR